MTFGN